ncbi:MAG: glycosyltransferase family 39 protein, partial [Rhodobacterales bacterium]|nr:glycosyltransferase family 39 protein [Rhodobacterales bacterium]
MSLDPNPPESGALSPRTLGLIAIGLALGFAVALPLLRPVLPVDETRYLSVAWEMQRDGSFVVPHLNGQIYSHKPPLLFWLINLVWSLTGVSEVAARLVAPAFGILSVALTWRLGARLFPDRPGLGPTAALILATTGIFALYGSLTMFDTMLTAATLLGVLALLRMDAGGGWPATLALGAVLAFGVLAKGPVILVHLMPLALTRPFWSLSPQPGRVAAWYGRVALAVAAALVFLAAWLVPALWLGGAEYREEILWRQSAGRMVNAFDHARPVWFFVAALPFLLWPWAWRPAALRGLVAGGLWNDRRARLLAIWGGSTVVLFSLISGKQIHYLLPEFPAVALLFARAFGEERLAGRVRHFAPILLILLGIGLLAAAAGIIAPSGDMALLLPRIAVVAVASFQLENYIATRQSTLGRTAADVLASGGRPALARWLRT